MAAVEGGGGKQNLFCKTGVSREPERWSRQSNVEELFPFMITVMWKSQPNGQGNRTVRRGAERATRMIKAML